VALRACILGDLESELGSLNEAKSHYRRALRIIESLCGQNHPDAATILNNLGRVAITQGELAWARACFERALAIFRANLKEGHPDIAVAQQHLEMIQEISSGRSTEDDLDQFYS
jgi:tetratricopeptide (TPR) repeat protein